MTEHEKLKWFWEKCGIEERREGDTGTYYFHYPNHQCDIELPPIDLNSLDRWALSQVDFGQLCFYLLEDGTSLCQLNYVGKDDKGYNGRGETRALALQAAISKVFEEASDE